MKYYKVVKNVEGKKVSAVAERSSAIEYSTNEYSKTPKFLKDLNRGPFVFDNYENAKLFADSEVRGDNLEVWECEIVNPNPPREFYDLSFLDVGKIIVSNRSFPPGTVECDRIILTKFQYSTLELLDF